MKDEFEYFDDKIEELNQLLSEAKSLTLKELISKSIILTESSLEILLQTQNASIKYLTKHNKDISQKLLNYKVRSELLNQRKKLLDIIPDNNISKTVLVNQFKTDSEIFQTNLNTEAQFNDLVLDAFTGCQAELKKTLLEFIVKPSNKEFHYEQVMDFINLLISKLPISGLSEVQTLSNLSVDSKKRKHINSGDKIILYIEQYNNVLERWTILSHSYIKIIES